MQSVSGSEKKRVAELMRLHKSTIDCPILGHDFVETSGTQRLCRLFALRRYPARSKAFSMNKIVWAAGLAATSLASSSDALTLLGAAVTGPTGTVWRTAGASIGNTSNYALFLAAPTQSSFINPNNEAISQSVSPGQTSFFLSGDGFPITSTANSDSLYTLTLDFDGGRKLTGTYTPVTNTFIGSGSIRDGRNTITLAEFSYVRFLGDSVSPFSASPGGNGNDYNGNIQLSSVPGAVPEPASWALLIGGIGMVGIFARRRNRNVGVAYA